MAEYRCTRACVCVYARSAFVVFMFVCMFVCWYVRSSVVEFVVVALFL